LLFDTLSMARLRLLNGKPLGRSPKGSSAPKPIEAISRT
jgi:hypothetical protein